MRTQEKLASIRALMEERQIDFYIIPSTDPHIGEYVPDHWRIISWLTGFTGSSATVVISKSEALLWTDSRYFIQARQQLSGSGIGLMQSMPGEKSDYSAWLAENIEPGSAIGLDGRIFAANRVRLLEKLFAGKKAVIEHECDLISGLWVDRPPLPVSAAWDFPVEFCGKSRNEKIAAVRNEMSSKKIDYQIVTSPDDIMWLLNIRGNDVKYCPVVLSFAIIGMQQVLLFVNESSIPLSLAREFDRIGVVLLPYEEAAGMVSALEKDSSILVSPSAASFEIFDSIPDGASVVEDIPLPSLMKSAKNKTEIRNIGLAMVRDGVALTKFFFWLENHRGEELTELSLSEKLDGLRLEQDNCNGPSFASIVAYNSHAALPHYLPTPESDCKIGDNGILLVDSGGQYFEGTTDITRTIAIGRPSERQKKDFTLVLRGMIDLASAVFPAHTRGSQLDILARRALWEAGLNYGHGTGHGVGFFLNVHEGPVYISPSTGSGYNNYIMPGMLISDEPAVYRPGEYGIRTENLVLCYEDEETEFGKFLRFDTVSLCYIDKNLIDSSLLEKKHIKWLNDYHSQVYEKLSPYLDSAEKEWLSGKTRHI